MPRWVITAQTFGYAFGIATTERRRGMDDWLNTAFALADKRESFCKNVKPCPKCGTDQVQLVEWMNDAKWKCRECGFKWEGI